MGMAELESLARRLHRPVDSLAAYAALDSQQLALLDQQLAQALSQRQSALDSALGRLLPAPLLRWLRRP